VNSSITTVLLLERINTYIFTVPYRTVPYRTVPYYSKLLEQQKDNFSIQART